MIVFIPVTDLVIVMQINYYYCYYYYYYYKSTECGEIMQNNGHYVVQLEWCSWDSSLICKTNWSPSVL